MGKIYPTREVLDDRLERCLSWYECCKSNLERHENGSAQHKRWIQHSVTAIKNIIDLEEMLEISTEREKKIATNGKKVA